MDPPHCVPHIQSTDCPLSAFYSAIGPALCKYVREDENQAETVWTADFSENPSLENYELYDPDLINITTAIFMRANCWEPMFRAKLLFLEFPYLPPQLQARLDFQEIVHDIAHSPNDGTATLQIDIIFDEYERCLTNPSSSQIRLTKYPTPGVIALVSAAFMHTIKIISPTTTENPTWSQEMAECNNIGNMQHRFPPHWWIYDPGNGPLKFLHQLTKTPFHLPKRTQPINTKASKITSTTIATLHQPPAIHCA